MTTYSIVREAQVETANTWVKLTGDGADGTLTDVRIDAAQHRIARVSASFGNAGTAGAGTVHVKFVGTASKNGTQQILLGSIVNVGTSVTLDSAELTRNVDIALQPGTLEIWAMVTGTGLVPVEVAIEATIDDKQTANGYYLVREGTLTTANAYTLLTKNGAVTESNPVFAGGKIAQVTIAIANGTTSGAATHIVRVEGIAGSVQGNVHDFVAHATSIGGGTLAASKVISPITKNVEITAKQGGEFKIYADMSGDDIGTSYVSVEVVVLP